MINKGKIFEERFKQDWLRCFPNDFLYRLADQVSGFKTTSSNPCDFIAFTHRELFLIECKSHDGASIPFDAIPQYERLLRYKDTEHVHPGFVVWFKEKDKVIWVPISTAEKIYNDGNKSVQLKMLKDNLYELYELPVVKKRVYLEVDYNYLVDLYNEDKDK